MQNGWKRNNKKYRRSAHEESCRTLIAWPSVFLQDLNNQNSLHPSPKLEPCDSETLNETLKPLGFISRWRNP